MKNLLISLCLSGSLFLISCEKAESYEVTERPMMGISSKNYTSNRDPLQPEAFIKLPVGSIEPGGWLKRYLELQRDGLTGHLGEISAWLQKEGNAWLSPDGEGEYGWEEVPYWLKGYGNLAYILKDPKMIDETKIWIDAALNSQQENGYFGPWVEKRGKPDLWGNMIMLWCIQSYYEYSNDEKVIPFMTRYFQWENQLPDSLFLKDYWENSRGGDNLLSVYWLYNITGDSFLLELAEKIHRNTADWTQQDQLPNRHNVNIAQSFREPATYYLQSRDSAHLRASYNDHFLIRRLFGQVPGGMFGGDENCRTGYHDPRQGVETCGMVEQMSSDEILLRITGDLFWADHCENVAFNSYPAAVMPDFKALHYITSPNMVLCDDKNHHPGIDNGGPFLIMNPFSSRCCQHNHTQGWPYYAENLWMATPDNGLAAVLYAENTVNAKVANGKPVQLSQQTHYPFDEQIRIDVKSADKVRFPLYLRIPGWCEKATISLNGQKIDVQAQASHYVKIDRTWKTGDYIELNFPMHLQVNTWEQNRNSVSLNYGPLTYSLKISEKYVQRNSMETAIWDSKWQKDADPSQWPSYEIFPDSPWNYALFFDKNNLESSFEIVKKSWPEDNFPFSQQSVPVEIKAKGIKVPGWKIDEYGLCSFVPQSPVATGPETPEDITLIPMGAARLRISAFPVAEK